MRHLWSWVEKCGPIGSYSAEVGERLNQRVYRCYRFIRTQKERHLLASKSLPFLHIAPSIPSSGKPLRFHNGLYYLYRHFDEDDSILKFDKVVDDTTVSGRVYGYHTFASIGSKALFYLYKPVDVRN
ncbi:hypothetical protein ADUPG1_005448, partial [Aduncisulcus paluster]